MSTPQTAVEVLIAARELISVPERWTQRAPWRDSSGAIAGADAVCWCGFGAVWKVTGRRFCDEADECEDLLERTVGCSYPAWNDHPDRTHAAVLAAFDKAIELARAEEA